MKFSNSVCDMFSLCYDSSDTFSVLTPFREQLTWEMKTR